MIYLEVEYKMLRMSVVKEARLDEAGL